MVKIEAAPSCEMLLNVYQTIWRHFSEDRTLHSHRCETLQNVEALDFPLMNAEIIFLSPSTEEHRGSKRERLFFLLIFIFNFICFHFFSHTSLFSFLIFVLLFLFPRFLPCFSLFSLSHPSPFFNVLRFFLVVFSQLLHFRLHSFLPPSLPFLSLFYSLCFIF
jgi:hypothetical protein